jgi:predicted RNA polymerase sigma factor
VRAHLLEMIGDRTAAIVQYRSAAARTTSIPERNYLIAQAARIAEGAGPQEGAWSAGFAVVISSL